MRGLPEEGKKGAGLESTCACPYELVTEAAQEGAKLSKERTVLAELIITASLGHFRLRQIKERPTSPILKFTKDIFKIVSSVFIPTINALFLDLLLKGDRRKFSRGFYATGIPPCLQLPPKLARRFYGSS